MNVADIARELGYTGQWLEWGIVDEAYLQSQYEVFLRSEDKNQEHYRCRAFIDFLARNSHLTDDLIDKVFLLVDCGPDGCNLQGNRAIELIVSDILTDEQHFALAQRHPGVFEKPIGKRYKRESLFRKIQSTGLAANFAEIQTSADKVIHLWLFEHPELSREHLEWLKSAGANKSIRNRAEATLGSKRFRAS